MYFTGFADEVSPDIDIQIKVTKALGWKNIETRNIYGKNLASISDEEFEKVSAKLSDAGVKFNCYGSAIANWQKPITESPESSYEEFRKAIPRMQKLGTKLVRMMSFAVPKELKAKSWDFEDEVVKRLKVIVKMAEDAGILCVHENCMNWGGLSYEHTLKLVERIDSPAFKLVFDTGNPVFNEDVRGKAPYKMQSSWEYYRNVRDHIAYIHIKDGSNEGDKHIFKFPGEGAGDVPKIVEDLLKRGYDGGISIEPHMVHVFHDPSGDPAKKEKFAFDNYIEYGKRMEEMVAKFKAKK
jgi:sugar phosphate isomerase/epimerase